jgi:YVTN family beta-propeller protein
MRLFCRSVALALGALLISVVVFGYGSQASGPQVDLPTIVTTVGVGGGGSDDGPQGVGVDTVTNKIFVANSLDNAIYVVNGDTNTVVATITDGRINRPEGVAVNPVSRKVYVANWGNQSLLVINADTNAITKEIGGMGPGPTNLAIDTSTNMVYVTNFNGNSISIVDGATDSLNNTVSLAWDYGAGQYPFGIALDTAQHRAYITHRFGNCPMYISVLDTQTLELSHFGDYPMCQPAGIAVRPAAGSVFVAQRYNGDDGGFPNGHPTLAIFDFVGGAYHRLVDWSAGLRLTLDGSTFYGNPVAVAYNPTTERVFVTSYGDSWVVVVDAVNLTVLTALPVGSHPDLGIGVNPVTSMVYVANRAAGSLTVIRDGAVEPTPTPTNTPTPTPPPCIADKYEPDNLPEQARAIISTFGYTQSHSFCGTVAPFQEDEDWVNFPASSGVVLTMTTANLTNGADTYLMLYGPDVATNGTKLAENDDIITGVLASRIVYTFTQSGMYFLRINNVGPVVTAAKLKALGITVPAIVIPQRDYDLAVIGGPPLNNRAFLPLIWR